MKKLILLVTALVFILMIQTFALADEGEHQHIRVLQNVITDDSSDMPFCGEFYCPECQNTFYDSITYEDVGMPVINIEGSLKGISKTNKVTVSTSYSSENMSFVSTATLKVQGGTSANYPKKNFSIQFLKEDGKKNKVKLVDAWGKQHKYCMKANYVDYTQSRNIVSGQLFSEIVHSRNINDELNALDWGGVVDGYPITVFLNGKFLGLYTMNIPKDNWMFGMNDETVRQALLFGDQWSDSVRLRTEIADVNNVEQDNWDIEYCSTEDDPEVGTSWVGESMNNFIRFLNESSDEEFKANVDQYTNVERAIDTLLYTYFIHANDNTAKNIIYATYDGVHWIPSPYDMDGTWGAAWNGEIRYSPEGFVPSPGTKLFERLLNNYPDEIKTRYVELRENILSVGNIQRKFASFIGQIPQALYDAEEEKWPEVPSHDTSNYDQIADFTTARVDYLDSYYDVSIEEQTNPSYRVSFEAPSGTEIFVYETQQYDTETPVETKTAFSRTKDGKPTLTDGQVNFLVQPKEGYVIKSIDISPADGYKNLKGKDDTGKDNTYRITKITSDLIVKINLVAVHTHKPSSDVDYVWSDDNLSCTASSICTICDQKFEEEVDSTYTVKKEASCEEEGLGEYTATFTTDGFEEQKKEVVIPKTPHNWGEASYLWNEDNSKVTAIRTCLNNTGHIQVETVNTVAEVTKEATCSTKGETTYTATFTKEGFETQTKTLENIDIKPHDLSHYDYLEPTCDENGHIEYWECNDCHKFFNETKEEIKEEDTIINASHKLTKIDEIPATCLIDGVSEYWKCDVCGKKFSDEDATTEIDEPATIDRLGHSWGDWVEVEASSCIHHGQRAHVCKNDPTHLEYESIELLDHTMTHHAKVDSTCTKTGNIEYWTCDVCKKYFADKDGVEEISKDDTIIAVKPHTLIEGDVLIPSNLTTVGVRLFKCKDCNDVTIGVIPKVEISAVTINDKVVTAKTVKSITSAVVKKGGSADTIVLGANVKKIKKNAFKGTAVKKLIIKTKKLKKKAIKKALKNSSVSTIVIRVGNAKQNRKFLKKYKKIFKKKIVGKKVKVIIG